MKVLITGNKGFVGTHIENALCEDDHEIVGLEVHPTFKEWVDEMERVVTPDIDAVIHAGAMPYNQSKDPKLFIWNAHATYMLARRVSEEAGINIPFVYFSTFLVSSTQDDWESRTPYGWSKVFAEMYLQGFMPHATILRPAVQWGDETRKRVTEASVPYLLATHQLKRLFANWGRSYVNIIDVCKAIKVCLRDNPAGIFELHTEYMNNRELAKLVKWTGYEWTEHPEDLGYVTTTHRRVNVEPILPNWSPGIYLADELPRMESNHV